MLLLGHTHTGRHKQKDTNNTGKGKKERKKEFQKKEHPRTDFIMIVQYLSQS